MISSSTSNIDATTEKMAAVQQVDAATQQVDAATAVQAATALTWWQLNRVDAQLQTQQDVTFGLRVDVMLKQMRVQASILHDDAQDVVRTRQRLAVIESMLAEEAQREGDITQLRQQLQQQHTAMQP